MTCENESTGFQECDFGEGEDNRFSFGHTEFEVPMEYTACISPGENRVYVL